MSIVTTVLPDQLAWAKPKLFYKHALSNLAATSTASGFDVENVLNRLETNKWVSGVTTTQYITNDAGYTAGVLTKIDSDDQGDTASAVWGDGNFIYLANGTGGLHSYSVDGSGNLTHIDSDDQGDTASAVWGDGNFIYLANYTGGLHSYSVDGSGNLTHIDSDDQGDFAKDVWGDGNFIYLANTSGGLHSYSVDGSGNLTHIDSDDQGDSAVGVYGDGNFIYLANDEGGLHSYSVDGSGNLTHIDSDDQGDEARHVWADGNFIYLANAGGGLHTYRVDGSGNLTHIDSDDQGDSARRVFGANNFIYVANLDGGILSYSVDLNGNLTFIDSDDQGDLAQGTWADSNFVYLANGSGGLLTYSDSTTENTISMDYLIVQGHNLKTAGTTVTLQYSSDAFLSDINNAFTGVVVSADTPFLKEFSTQSSRYSRIKIENATVAPQITICYWGETVELDYTENDFDPNAFNDKATINVSQTGYVLGIYNKYKEREFTLSWNEADSDLYDKIKNLVDTVGRQNFIIAWETAAHSSDVYLVYISGEFRNPYVRQAQYRNVSLRLKGRVE